ncbi:hypothetical protein [Iodobacter fluviatilis]|uniref:MalT-like TPR region domain-containing protein n=1 Tax=Iodobacter fluviatilis TaxID=537 RepID=A0A377Q9Y6_9NEIS|nr:hypothetical protein [Iodobacter fluviatilis]TCU88420.1 hypothetical protein EV682_1033 [Iodobacter fluviatilis]STQ91508.1 Uncharacterised protein [Iodobacter fluviatilis]
MTFDNFIKTAWADHGDQPLVVAERLSTSPQLAQTSSQIQAFTRLITHVYGEHLADWDAGIALLQSLPRLANEPAALSAIAVSTATLKYGRGDQDALASLTPLEQTITLATASSLFAAQQKLAMAIDSYSQALMSYPEFTGLPEEIPVHRALAVGGNHLACVLEEQKQRSTTETAAMLQAAQSALKHWQRAGSWLETERAQYRLCRSNLQAGLKDQAVQAARRCLEICTQNNAPAFELFFAHAVLAIAQKDQNDAFELHRAAAIVCLEQVPADEQHWCEAELKELNK